MAEKAPVLSTTKRTGAVPLFTGAIARLLQTITGPWTWRNLVSWVVVILAILSVKGCLVDQYTIPSGSMEPTLIGDPRFFRGDRVLVNKWSFGPRIPFTTRRLWTWAEPKRWDIVVFRSVEPDAKHPVLIKRVVGLPGEKVHIADGRIWINGRATEPPPELRDVLDYTTEIRVSDLEKKRQFLRLAQTNQPIPMLNSSHGPVQTLYAEMARKHGEVQSLDLASLDKAAIEALCADVDQAAINLIKNMFVFTQPNMPYGISENPEFSIVPEGHYFLLGDNSGESHDGRMYGWVPHNRLYGRAFAVWWPWPHRRDFTGFSHTWWGMLLVYGLPVGLVGMELFFARRARRKPAP